MFEFVRVSLTDYVSAWQDTVSSVPPAGRREIPVTPASWLRVESLIKFVEVCGVRSPAEALSLRLSPDQWRNSESSSAMLKLPKRITDPATLFIESASRFTPADHVVLAIGSAEVVLSAALLASQTCRGVVHMHTVREAIAWLKETCVSSITILLAGTVEEIWPVLTTQPNTSVGFLWASHPSELEWLVLKTLCYHQTTFESGYDTFARPGSQPASIQRTQFGLEIEGDLRSVEWNTLMMKPKRLMAILSHSDGLSLMLGSSVLCTRVLLNDQGLRPSGPLPVCFLNDYCGRLRARLSDMQAEGRLLSPIGLCAGIFLNFSCWGTHYPFSATTDLSLAAALRASAHIGAVVSTIGSPPLAESQVRILADAIKSGIPSGTAVMHLNHVIQGERIELPTFVLFGDALYTPYPHRDDSTQELLQAQGGHRDTPAFFSGEVPEAGDPDEVKSSENVNTAVAPNGLSFLSVLLDGLSRSDIPAVSTPVSAAITLLTAAKLSLNCVQDPEVDLVPQLAHRNAVLLRSLDSSAALAVVAQMVNVGSLLIHVWSDAYQRVSLRKESRCWVCRRSVIRSTWRNTTDSKDARHIDCCMRCGVVRDGPLVSLSSDIRPPELLQMGRLLTLEINPAPGANSTWALVLEKTGAKEAQWVEPMRSSGSFSMFLSIPDDVPAGIAVLSLMGLCEGNCEIWRAPVMMRSGR